MWMKESKKLRKQQKRKLVLTLDSLIIVVRFNRSDQSLLHSAFRFVQLLFLLDEEWPGRPHLDPASEAALLLSHAVIGNVTQLHSDLFIRLEEESNRHWEEEVIEREDEDQRPGIVELLVDWIVLLCVANAESEADDREDTSNQRACLLYIGTRHEVQHDNHHDEEWQHGQVEDSDARKGAIKDIH